MASYHHLISRPYLSSNGPYSRLSITLHSSSNVTLRVPSCQDQRFPSNYKKLDSNALMNNVSIKSRLPGKGRHGHHVPKFSASGDIVEPLETVKKDRRPWTDLFLPENARPYAYLARLQSLTTTWLYIWPSLWSVAFAAEVGKLPDLKLLALFSLLSLITRGIACTINDYFDRDIDEKVERTKQRPLVTGAVSPFHGLCFLVFQVLLGFGVVLPLDDLSRSLWASSLLLFLTYPLMKRITYWPQAYLGLAMSTGALYGWTAVKGSLNLSILIPIFLSGIFWTLAYDTIYAHQDREDDIKVGVKSTAVLFGDSTKEWVTGFGVACIGCLALAGYNANHGWLYYASLAAGFGHLAWQILTVDLANPDDCKSKFLSNKWFGAMVFAGTILGRLVH